MSSKDIYIDQENLKKGLYALEDTTKAPLGTARVMRNMRVTDKGGIAPRLGTIALGTASDDGNPTRGITNYRRAFGSNQILVRAHDTKLEGWSLNHNSSGWFTIKDGLTADKEFDYVPSLVNTENKDYLVLSNRYDGYMRWTGAITQLSSNVTAGATSVPVGSTLTEEIFFEGTANGGSTTTLTIADSVWAVDQWIGFHILTPTGDVRKITDSTANSLTFNSLGYAIGSGDEFSIRKLAFSETGSIVYAGTEIAYTTIQSSTAFAVSSAHAGSDNDIVSEAVEMLPDAPKGDRLENYLARIVVGNVRSGTARGSGGALQGYSSAGSVFLSRIQENDDFSFDAARLAGQGDIISMPIGGGDITDIAAQEDVLYVFKPRYIESLSYSQDENDLPIREPLKSGVGSVNRVIKGTDDVFFMTPDKQFTTIGRVEEKDLKPQTQNIGTKIKTLIESYGVTEFDGIEDRERVYFAVKKDKNDLRNNLVLPYNRNSGAFEGEWDIHANSFAKFGTDEDIYFGSSQSSTVYQMNVGHADVEGTKRYPIVSEYASHFMNLTSSKINLQAMNSIYFEGYLVGNTKITFSAWKDFTPTPFLSFDFSGEDENLLKGGIIQASLGSYSLGLTPSGTISTPDNEGRRHFQFRVYFPYQYANYFSVGWSSNGVDLDYEVIRYGLGLKEAVNLNKLVKYT